MPLNIANLLGTLGATSAGAVPVIQQQQQNAAVQSAIRNYMAQQQSAQQPGFSVYPSSNAGTPVPAGAPGAMQPPGGPVPLIGPNGPVGGQPPSASMPPGAGAPPQVAPYSGPATPGASNPADPWMNAFFGPGSDTNSQSVPAFQSMMKTLMPYGQIQGRAQLETQREGNRETLEADKQKGRAQLLQQKNQVVMRGQDKNYQARIAAIGARATPAQQAELKAATTEFTQASANYRNAKISMNSSLEDIDALADKAVTAQKKMESVAASIGGGESAPAGAGGPAAPAKVKINKGEEVRYDDQGNAFVNRNGQAVPAEQ